MMRKSHLLLMAMSLLLTLSFASYALASEKVVLDFGERQIFAKPNDPAFIFLKKEMHDRFPQINISSLALEKVVILAKSRRGHGTVQLKVGKNVTPKAQIAGSPQAFYSPARHTFDRVQLNNPSYNSNGPWRLLLRGNIVISKIVLIINDDQHIEKRHKHDSSTWPGNQFRNENSIESRIYVDKRHDRLHSRQPLLPLLLPARSWGTDIEGEMARGQKSNNRRDGWDYPDTITETYSKATYRSGYQPTSLFIRPDSRVIDQYSGKGNIRALQIALSATAGDNHNKRAPLSATFGISINGRTYSQTIHIDNSHVKNRKVVNKTLNISGDWSADEIRNSHIWILPSRESCDFTVTELQSFVTSFK